jgi:hypothetical protein
MKQDAVYLNKNKNELRKIFRQNQCKEKLKNETVGKP